jgi:citronellol/citronellal dehydrogenase
MSLQGKTVFITGGSRGIGKAMALKLAGAGANIVIAAKSVEEDPRLGGTIFSAAAEVEALGVKALAVQVDIRDEAQIAHAIQKTVDSFGGIDIVINNASAIQLTDTAGTPSKRFDLMHSINVRGTFLVVQHALPYLKKSSHAHILTLSPPINIAPKWLGPHVAYTISKYDMSMMTLGWAEEFKEDGIACNSLWPRTTIDTAAVRNLLVGQYESYARHHCRCCFLYFKQRKINLHWPNFYRRRSISKRRYHQFSTLFGGTWCKII